MPDLRNLLMNSSTVSSRFTTRGLSAGSPTLRANFRLPTPGPIAPVSSAMASRKPASRPPPVSAATLVADTKLGCGDVLPRRLPAAMFPSAPTNEPTATVEAPTRVSAAGEVGPDVVFPVAVRVFDAVAVTALAAPTGPASRVRIAVRTAARRRTSDRAGDPVVLRRST